MTLKGHPKLTSALNNYFRNLVNFHLSSRKSGNLHFDGLFLSKAYRDLDEKVKKSSASWHWRLMQIWRKTDSWFQNDMRNIVNLNASSGKSENLHFDVLLLSKAYKVWAKTEELSLMTLKSDPNFEEKLTFCLKNDMRNLVNFNPSSGKSENLNFDGLLL